MKVKNLIDNNESDNIIDEQNDKRKKSNSKFSLPFLDVNIEKLIDINNASYKLEKTKSLINLRTDKLLIAGFEGNEEDFRKCYKKIEPIKIKKITNLKQKKLNKLLVKDDYLGPMKKTKVKEFNVAIKEKNKLIDKLNQLKNTKKVFDSYFNFKSNKSNNSNIMNNSSSKNNYYTSSLNNNSTNINNNTSINYYNSSLNNLKGSYFFYKNNNQSKSTNSLNHRTINQNNLVTLRDILTNTSHHIDNINYRIKKYVKNKNDKYIFIRSDKTKKLKRIKTYDKIKKSNLYEVLDSVKKKHKDQILKQIKKDEGIRGQNIWIKRSTANLISFGKAFLYLADDLFYREHKRIIDKYPEIEKDADLPVPEKNRDVIIKQWNRLKMEKNSKIMKDLNFANKTIMHKIIAKAKLNDEKKY